MTKTEANVTTESMIWGQFHQQVYSKFLQPKIPKFQKDSQEISVFLHIGI